MTEKEQQFNQWFDQYANGVKVFEEADMKQAYLQGRADLEKENAELRKDKKELCHSISEGGKACVYLNGQLTKAKEIIKELMSFSVQLCDCRHTVDFEKTREEAEQFLSEVEK